MGTYKNFFIKLLYFTPIGYLLRLMSLCSGKATPGVYVYLPERAVIKVYVKRNPLFQDKLNWLLNGSILIFQGFYIFLNKIGGDLGVTYSWLALVFGFVSFLSALFPSFNWNGRKKIIKLSFIEIVVIVSLIISVVASDIVRVRLP